MNRSRKETVWIVGAGRVGRLLAGAERTDGATVRCFDIGQFRFRIGGKSFAVENGPIAGTPHRIWFAVPDDRLADIILQWRAAGCVPRMALHTSGWHLPEQLAPLAPEYLALHPMRTLLGKSIGEWCGAIVSLSGTVCAMKWGEGFAKRRGAVTAQVAPEVKPWLHLYCQFAANVPFALLAALESLPVHNAMPESLLRRAADDMLTRSLRHAAKRGIAAAVTGPVARADIEMVKDACQILAGKPVLENFYRAYAALLATYLSSNCKDKIRTKRLRALMRWLETADVPHSLD